MHTTPLLAHYRLAPVPLPARVGGFGIASARTEPITATRPFVARRLAAIRPARRSRPGGPNAARPDRRRLAPRLRWQTAVAAVLLVLVAVGFGLLRVWPPFAVVMSGSMAPTINTGDLVVLQRLRAPARAGDVVAVDVPETARARYGYPPVVIHRVFRITGGQIRTKGDARPRPDPFTVPRTAVGTKVVAHIPSGGRVLTFFHSAPGLLWLLSGGALFFGLPLLERQRNARRRETEATAGVREQLAIVTSELTRLRAEHARSLDTNDETLSQLDRLTLLVEEALGKQGPEPPGEPRPVSARDGSALSAGDASQLATGRRAPGAEGRPPPTGCAAAARLETSAPSGDGSAKTPARTLARSAVPVVSICEELTAVVAVAPPLAAIAGERWDAPPPAALSGDSGWSSPPARLHPKRFQRPGRLVAASVAQSLRRR